MPPPMMSIFFGTLGSSSALVESRMRGSSGRNGSFAACEPTAMIAFANRSERLSPFASMASSCGPVNVATPCSTVTLRIFAIAARPPVSFPTTLFLNVRSFARSSLGSP